MQGDWDRLLTQSSNRNVFLTFDWLTTWWRNFKDGRELFVVVAERGGEVVGIAPLVTTRGRLGARLEFLGRPGSDYSDFIGTAERPLCVNSLLEFIWSTWGGDIVALEGVPEDSPHLDQLVAAFGHPDRPACHKPLYLAPYLRIDRGWEEYRKTVRKKLVQDTGRQMRRLQEQGTVIFERCPDTESAGVLVEEMISQKRARFRATGAKDIFSDRRFSAFYHEITERFLPKGWLDVSYVQLDGTVLAIHFGFIYHDRFFYYMPSFRQEYSVYSPSRLLLNHQLQAAFEDGLTEFDFLSGDEQYKYEWTTDVRNTYAFVASSSRAYSRLVYRFHMQILPMLKSSWLVRGTMHSLRRRAAMVQGWRSANSTRSESASERERR